MSHQVLEMETSKKFVNEAVDKKKTHTTAVVFSIYSS